MTVASVVLLLVVCAAFSLQSCILVCHQRLLMVAVLFHGQQLSATSANM
jgi:hypothetical protein